MLISLPLAVELRCVVQDFVEDGNKMYRKVCRAWTLIRSTYWIRHMGLVIWRVQVSTIPAGREEDLRSQSAWTSIIRYAICLGFTSSNTGEIDRQTLAITRKVSFSGITREHPETLRKGFELITFWPSLTKLVKRTMAIDWVNLQVVDSHATIAIRDIASNWHRPERTVPLFDVQLWCPIDGHVLCQS